MECLAKKEWGAVCKRFLSNLGLICDSLVEAAVFSYILTRTIYYHKLEEGEFYIFDFRCGNDWQSRCPHPQHRTSWERAVKNLVSRGILVMTTTGTMHVYKVRIEALGLLERLLSIEMKHQHAKTRQVESLALSGLRELYREKKYSVGKITFRPEVEKLIGESLFKERKTNAEEVRRLVRAAANRLEEICERFNVKFSQSLPTGHAAAATLSKIRDFEKYCERKKIKVDETLERIVRAWSIFYLSNPVDDNGKPLSIGKTPRLIDFYIYHRNILHWLDNGMSKPKYETEFV